MFARSQQQRLGVGARIGAGAMFATWSDEREGTFRSAETATGVVYRTPPRAEDGSVIVPFLQPELRVGYRVSRSWMPFAALSASTLFSFTGAAWHDDRQLAAGQCPDPSVNRCAGLASYGDSRIAGPVVVLMGLTIGARYEL